MACDEESLHLNVCSPCSLCSDESEPLRHHTRPTPTPSHVTICCGFCAFEVVCCFAWTLGEGFFEGAVVHRARAGQLFGLILIPIPVFGVDSTPRMGEWPGRGWGGDGAIWDDFSSWTYPFSIGDMNWPLSLT